MFKLLFGFFLTIHVLGDFYFQSDKLSEKKRNRYRYVALHSLIYFLVSCACAIPFWSIIADQLIHLGSMFSVASLFVYLGFNFSLLSPISNYLSSITENPGAILGWVGLTLVALKPANITIKQLVAQYKPVEEPNNSNKAGAFIGTVERLTILVLLSVEQYSAIGLVLTAKSVARYNKISEEKQFAEYYLLGTLLSALLAIGTYLLYVR